MAISTGLPAKFDYQQIPFKAFPFNPVQRLLVQDIPLLRDNSIRMSTLVLRDSGDGAYLSSVYFATGELRVSEILVCIQYR